MTLAVAVIFDYLAVLERRVEQGCEERTDGVAPEVAELHRTAGR
jgi:hypothetical protein